MIEQEIIIRRHKGGAISITYTPKLLSFMGICDIMNKAMRVVIMKRGYNLKKGHEIDITKPAILKDD